MLERGRVIGTPVTAASLESVSDEIMRAARGGRGGYVCVANVHMTTTARRDPRLAEVMERAFVVSSDGMPLVWALRRQGHAAERVTGPDLMLRLCEQAAAESMPVYFYGSTVTTIDALVQALASRYPMLQRAGSEAPAKLPPRPPLDIATARRIENSGARLVFVGLGCPKQEFWIATHSPHLSAILIGVGAAFEFHAGKLRRAPSWMQRNGLEWLFRLSCEPRRLWKRYLVSNTLFVWYLAAGWWLSIWGKRHR